MKEKALIINNDAEFCYLIESYLQKKNYEVSIVQTFEEALKTIPENIPDVILFERSDCPPNATEHLLALAPHVKFFSIPNSGGSSSSFW